MAIKDKLSGNEAVAVAMRQIDPDVVAAFPITPSTEVPQYFSQFVADGKVHTEFVAVESEHSAMSACIGAQAAGGRTITATASAGLALMWEMLYIAASSRLPIALAVTNRALSGPINIHNDHSDSMGARDSGWIQLYCENCQEAYDTMVQALPIGEHIDVQLPVMVCYDGFITSHAVENVELLEDEKVKAFVGTYKPESYLLNDKAPIAMGPLDLPPHYFEHKRSQAEGMINSKKVILEVADKYAKLTGRQYGLFEEYKMEDAEVAIIILNSTAGTAKVVVDQLREQGVKAGLIKLRVFRPFPIEELGKAISGLKAIAVMDKCDSFSAAGGPVFAEVRSAMFDYAKDTKAISYIYGLGGRDVRTDEIMSVYEDIIEVAKTGQVKSTFNYLGVRE